MLSIGQLSRVTKLTVKTIRLYHEKGLLPPAHVDARSGYRYCDRRSLERARIIVALRELEFSLAEIGEILAAANSDADALEFFEQQRHGIAQKARHYASVERALSQIIQVEKEAQMATQTMDRQVREKVLEPMLVAGIRTKGNYADTGKLFGKLGRAVGSIAHGKPLNLYYDGEYKREDADFECCFPVKKAAQIDGIDLRELPGGRCLSLVHYGPYEELHRSYAQLFAYVEERHLETLLPSREVYLKGPGMIFRGNPKKYVTEIQIMLTTATVDTHADA